MKKLLFIRIHGHIPYNVVIPPMGILYLIPPVREYFPEYIIDIYDTALPERPLDRLTEYVKKTDPDILLFSFNYYEKDLFVNVSRNIREKFPEKLIVAGGPGITCSAEEIAGEALPDYFVLGEGEERIVNILSHIEDSSVSLMDGCGKTENGVPEISRNTTVLSDTDRWGIPAWDMVDLNRFSRLPTMNSMLKRKKYATIMTSRGCPFKCPFCSSFMRTEYRARSVESVIKELKMLYSAGVREFHFLDDTFNVPEKRAIELLEAISEQGLDIASSFQGIRIEYISREFVHALKSAGCYKVEFGVQHVDPEITRFIRRDISDSELLRKHRLLKQAGFITNAHFIFGFPGETLEKAQKNLDFAIRLDATYTTFFRLTPFPGTEYENLVEKLREIPSINLNYYNRDPGLNLSSMTNSELIRFQRYAYRKFHYRPIKMIRTFLRLPKNLYFFTHVLKEFYAHLKDRSRDKI
ncbi:MAG: B12-binding domain-containing radical SAM protein [Candidatus Muiribacteriaceae bacterium]